MSSSSLLSLQKFTSYSTAWADFIVGADFNDIQGLFRDHTTGQAQLYASFDLVGTVIPLLSTVGIAMVRTRFVLLPDAAGVPTFGLVAYAADALGGRISAYYLAASQWTALDGQLKSCANMPGAPTTSADTSTTTDTLDGIVSFNLAKTWICNWCWAVKNDELTPAMFTTSYGPLQGYDFELKDFLDPLFQMTDMKASAVRAIFGLKQYYPAYPEGLENPISTFEIVIRPYTKPKDGADDGSVDGGTGGGSSYDQSVPNPPGM